MKRLIFAPEVPASQMVLTIITDEQLEAFADAVITKYQQSIARRKASEPTGRVDDPKGGHDTPKALRLHNDQVGPGGESNPHIFKGYWILSPARLPVPPSGLMRTKNLRHFV